MDSEVEKAKSKSPDIRESVGINNLESSLNAYPNFASIEVLQKLELWGGVECTINRVGDVYFDQFAKSGHRQRVDLDLARFADLGIKTLRTAIHWERYDQERSWESFDRLISALEKHKIEPIVGLVHHGSGPASTDLLDPEFPERLAEFAFEVAARYPSIKAYTPVNEPQTTARFACLYGHWYPHARCMKSYTRALFHEIKGTALAMEAIRRVNPKARLIYTEDGGQIFSTPQLEPYKSEREQRRWLGTDLLCGLVTREHSLFGFLLEQGFDAQEILWFEEHPCQPDIIGLNYYVTSDRFLDDRKELYPRHWAGGDTGSEPLVDVEAVRVSKEGIGGVGPILRQAWERYGLPVAITEAHIGCAVDQQILWLTEIWQDALKARRDGVDVRAVTVWALLGSFNWSHLCTEDTDAYEPGVFELKDGELLDTDLSHFVKALANSQPELRCTCSGWWHDPERFTVPAA